MRWGHERGGKMGDGDNATEFGFLYTLDASRMSQSSEKKELEKGGRSTRPEP